LYYCNYFELSEADKGIYGYFVLETYLKENIGRMNRRNSHSYDVSDYYDD
jgi:hypothetical protein